jgi:glucokinase
MSESRAIGVDIGGTAISVGLVGESGSLEGRRSFPTEPERGFAEAMEKIARAVDELLGTAGCRRDELAGIGIGCAGPLNPATGTIHNPFTLPGWEGANPVRTLEERFALPAYLENDADAALLGEVHAGAARGLRNVVMLTFGTGVGGGSLIDGRLHRGANGEHPEIGHLLVDPEGPTCYCGVRGCLESLASGSALARAGQAEGFADAAEVFEKAGAEDAGARSLVERAVSAVASAFWTLLHTFAPQKVVFGGGVMERRFEVFLPALRERALLAERAWGQPFPISKATLGNDAGMMGAAFRALRADALSTIST